MTLAQSATPTVQPHEYGDYDDAESDYTSSDNSIRKPLHGFGSPSAPIHDNGSPSPKRARGGLCRNSITVRSRRRQSLDEVEEEVKEGLLANAHPRRKAGLKRSWYIYCMFGGLGCLNILALILFFNLALGIATLMWPSRVDTVLQNWGKPGTDSEGLAWYPTDFLRDVNPIACHSHNDYWRRVPLFDALRAGCSGVEADVWLFDNDLYVGHNTASLTRNRTFTSLYVNPLVKILEHQNPTTEFYNDTSHGVFDTDSEKSLTLLVDVKTGGADTWQWVLDQLEPLRERSWLTYVENGVLHPGPVTVVGTGNTRFDLLTKNQTYRDAFFDAPLDTMWEASPTTPANAGSPELHESLPGEELDEGEEGSEAKLPSPAVRSLANVGQGMSGVLPTDEFNDQNSYYASVSFGKAVGHVWQGRLSPSQMKVIRGQIRGAHRRGLKARYWDLPSWPVGLRNHIWDVLVKEGVDMLNVDDLKGVSKQVW